MHGHQQHVRPLAFGHQRDPSLGQYPPSGGAPNPGSGILLPPLTSPVFAEETSYSPQSESSSRGSAPQRPFVPDAAYRRTSTGAYSAEGATGAGSISGGADLNAASRFNFKREILTRNGMTIGSWTREESNELMVLVDGFKQVEPNNAIPWTRIGRQLRHPRTGAQCHAHYTEALDPKILKGRWNAELDAELLRLAVVHDNSWVKISAELPNKTQRQCRSRWVALLRKRERDQLKTTALGPPPDVSQEQGLPSGSGLQSTAQSQAKSPSGSKPSTAVADTDIPPDSKRSLESHERVDIAPSTESVDSREPAQVADDKNRSKDV
ncbi:hypothetical protein BCR37DRAFT_391339 [Protomyces lactucae-debilis]|uniref:Homeodomain-like protein n=1 Tax=Protomyces lactucae-debilis TaxID=2754530 RepID=A0A1Y2FPN4_PROLT|nr:uncharacterized protein BCR37DRAFT_391339 [Protomyces lactucae-debilis]ORY85567.1 hypothetical protein BCR37DRAFT_391339 [Protomyces lactucae-debilis]